MPTAALKSYLSHTAIWFFGICAAVLCLAIALPFGPAAAQGASAQRAYFVVTTHRNAARFFNATQSRIIDQPHRLAAIRSFLIITPAGVTAAQIYKHGALLVLTAAPKVCDPTLLAS